MILQIQSIIIAIHTPIAPNPMWLHRTREKLMRHIIIEAMEVIIVKRTSLAALRAFGKTKEAGHINMAKPACIITRIHDSLLVSGDKENRLSSGFKNIRINPFVIAIVT